MSDTAKVYLVGAGLGDPDLLTRKAERLLRRAAAIIYDRLVSAEVLALANPGATFIHAGKTAGQQEEVQAEIYAWYLLDPQGWSFRPDSVREQLIIDGADAYAQLVKRSIHIRVTTRPYPVSRWAADHDANAIAA